MMYKKRETFALEFLNKKRLTEDEVLAEKRKEYWEIYKKQRDAKEDDNVELVEEIGRQALKARPTRLKIVNKDYPFK